MGASGVGLYRTEYLFLTHPDVPDEEEQFAAYKEIIAASPNHRITIRTLDLGGDKTIPYLGPCPRGQSVHGLALDPLVVRASGVFRHADPGDLAGRVRQEERRAA